MNTRSRIWPSAFVLVSMSLTGCGPSTSVAPTPASDISPSGEVQTVPPSIPPSATATRPGKQQLLDPPSGELSRALVPTLPQAEEFPSQTALERTTLWDRGEWPQPLPTLTPISIPLPAVRSPQPSPPVERTPLLLGIAAAEDLGRIQAKEKPLLRASSPPNPGAADVPLLARQVLDRASLEDPTAEISRNRIVQTPWPLPAIAGPILKLLIPDPFELAEHLKAPIPSREFGTRPVVVPPARP